MLACSTALNWPLSCDNCAATWPQLSKVSMSRLRQRADATGMTEDALVMNLLEVIAQDDLFDAVLDTAKGAA
jgi:hypothetical protein